MEGWRRTGTIVGRMVAYTLNGWDPKALILLENNNKNNHIGEHGVRIW